MLTSPPPPTTGTRPVARLIVAAYAAPVVIGVITLLLAASVPDDSGAILSWGPFSMLPAGQSMIAALTIAGIASGSVAMARAQPRHIWIPAVAIWLNSAALIVWFIPGVIEIFPA
ncbi:hypothetical protein [Herbiconiux sp.]|uniref:hypothetical protein n=1 Tax=Herbiconiux sp. TaxID=1871186 RepID=UPI0025BCF48A|nr:hypothetical protein [Herbiconiux sp.]